MNRIGQTPGSGMAAGVLFWRHKEDRSKEMPDQFKQSITSLIQRTALASHRYDLALQDSPRITTVQKSINSRINHQSPLSLRGCHQAEQRNIRPWATYNLN